VSRDWRLRWLDPAIVWNGVEEHIPKLLACKISDLPGRETDQ